MSNFRIALNIPPFPEKINHHDRILLLGSCFTEHISRLMTNNKFTTHDNPNGILFNPASISRSIISYIEQKQYSNEDLFYFNELWNSWDHHSRFSHPDRSTALKQINTSLYNAHAFLKQADWLIITLGTAFVYERQETTADSYPKNIRETNIAANCHKMPADQFRKKLMTPEDVFTVLDNLRYRLTLFNPKIKVIYTISPVRHTRDGLIENNRSKATLIQAVHHVVEKFENHFYFPAYELVIDDLRDYRFYEEDMIHPNDLAITYVWDKFAAACINPSCYPLMKEMERINMAMKHRPFNPNTEAHRLFLNNHRIKLQALQQQYPFLNFSDELNFFT